MSIHVQSSSTHIRVLTTTLSRPVQEISYAFHAPSTDTAAVLQSTVHGIIGHVKGPLREAYIVLLKQHDAKSKRIEKCVALPLSSAVEAAKEWKRV